MPALKQTLNEIISHYVQLCYTVFQHAASHFASCWGGNEIGRHSDADSKCPLHPSLPTRQPCPIHLPSVITPRWIPFYCLDSTNFLCPYRSYFFLYNATVHLSPLEPVFCQCCLTMLMLHAALGNCSAWFPPIKTSKGSLHRARKRSGYGGGGRERSSFYHPLSISQKRVGCSILY